jgi:dTDP-4-dehydrorhamnose 3,5-epimerase
LIFSETPLKGAFVIDLELRSDDRGFFARTFCAREFAEHGLNVSVAQANIALNRKKGAIRGLHFQYPPAEETKLVRCTHGALLDVIVDLRPESPTYLQHVSVELTDSNRRALYVPARFAHGYQVLDDETETTYLMGEFYLPEAAGGLRYSDPRLAITWPLPPCDVTARDQQWPLLDEAEPAVRQRMAVTAGA